MNTPILLVALVVLMFGVNTVFWALAGGVRWVAREAFPRGAHERAMPLPHGAPPTLDQVAVLMAAHNESAVIGAAIHSATRLIAPRQIFVVSDGSSDDTVEVARAAGATVLDLSPNRGKAGALAAGVGQFELAERFEVVLILDADTELDPDYFVSGLPLFADPGVAVVAGRASTQWNPSELSALGRVVVAHRERIYVILQRLVKYGQASTAFDAVAIAPGFASMYRARVLRAVEMNPPGLVIEDFNMTFEIHRHGLGRIAFHPSAAVARTQDPDRLPDYIKQVRRWALGFWQTVRLHGLFHRGPFWLALAAYCCELILSCVVLLVTAALLAVDGLLLLLGWLGPSVALPSVFPSATVLLLVVLVPDLVLTCLVATGQRRGLILAAAPAYPLLRLVDSWLCLSGLAGSFGSTSSGRWSSPARRAAAAPAAPLAPVAVAPARTGTDRRRPGGLA